MYNKGAHVITSTLHMSRERQTYHLPVDSPRVKYFLLHVLVSTQHLGGAEERVLEAIEALGSGILLIKEEVQHA